MNSILWNKKEGEHLLDEPIRRAQQPIVAYALAFGLGALTVLGYAPFNYFLLPVFTLAALIILVTGQTSAKKAMLSAFAFGLGKFGLGVSWIYISLHSYGGMQPVAAALATFLFCAYLAIFPALFGLVCWRCRHSGYSFYLLFVPGAWVAFEWLRGTFLTGFPWLAMGYSQVAESFLAGYAPVLGMYGVSAFVAVSAAMLIKLQSVHGYQKIVPVAAILSVWGIGGLLQEIQWTSPSSVPFRVALLQGNVPQNMKWRPDHLKATLDKYFSMVERSQAQLVVMPETALPLFEDQVPEEYANKLSSLMRAKRADLIIGVVERASDGGNVRYYNSAVSTGVSPRYTYRKQHLVPFGEYIPAKPLFGWVLNLLHIPLADMSFGETSQPAFQLAVGKVAINICFEDVFGEEIIQSAAGVNLLVNLSNLAWFGNSLALPQHLQISQMRALETGKYMLRATNTGITAIIDEHGHVIKQANPVETAILTGMAQGFTGRTPYVFLGNSVILILVTAAISLAFLFYFRQRKN